MEKTELIFEVAKEAGVSEDEAGKILDSFIETIKEGLLRGEKVAISGFGTFSISRRDARDFVNPKTKKIHQLPERLLPNFKAGRNFQKALRK